MLKETYHIPGLPPKANFETLEIMKALNLAARNLAEVKGSAPVIPNQSILIDTLSLQEAKDSSEIENIVTTNDELFKATPQRDSLLRGPAKEVSMYRDALLYGYENLKKNNLITNTTLVEMFRILKNRTDGFRRLPGTALQNTSGENIYIPPQNPDAIIEHMKQLEAYINQDDGLDPLIRMAIIHHQFESIHPFPDGNGRVGRMLNVLYLAKSGLLNTPILYMSRGINKTKPDYYRLLQKVREEGAWEEWVIYILNIVSGTAQTTLGLIEGIRAQMAGFKHLIRKDHGKVYSQDLINSLFRHPYTRIEYIMTDLNVSRPTASSYLETLSANAELPIEKVVEGRNNYYMNMALVDILSEIGSGSTPE